MAKNKLTFSAESDLFGTTIRLRNRDKTFDKVIVKTTTSVGNPFKKSNTNLEGGYLYHSPDMKESGWEDTVRALEGVSGEFSISATLDKKLEKVSALLRVAEQDDAAVIAWSTVNIWEKWGAVQAEEEIARVKQKPIKAKLGKDGRLTAKVTVTRLSDIT